MATNVTFHWTTPVIFLTLCGFIYILYEWDHCINQCRGHVIQPAHMKDKMVVMSHICHASVWHITLYHTFHSQSTNASIILKKSIRQETKKHNSNSMPMWVPAFPSPRPKTDICWCNWVEICLCGQLWKHSDSLIIHRAEKRLLRAQSWHSDNRKTTLNTSSECCSVVHL